MSCEQPRNILLADALTMPEDKQQEAQLMEVIYLGRTCPNHYRPHIPLTHTVRLLQNIRRAKMIIQAKAV